MTKLRTKTHELKLMPEYFDVVANGEKTFEFRYNDRGFQKGDFLRLREYNDKAYGSLKYTGREIFVVITYVLAGRFPHYQAPDLYSWAILAIQVKSTLDGD